MELLVVFGCPWDGVTGPLHVLRTYCLTHLLLRLIQKGGAIKDLQDHAFIAKTTAGEDVD
jgi:hypothetical protein